MAEDERTESLEEKPYRPTAIPERYPKVLVPERYPPGKAPLELFGPVSATVFASLQEAVNRVAGEVLVDRKVLCVDYVEGVVPEGGEREPDQDVAPSGGSAVRNLPLRGPDTASARLLQQTFALSDMTLDLLERCPERADTSKVVTATRSLAGAEVSEVFSIVAKHTGIRRVSGDSDLTAALAAVADLQAEGFGPDIAVVYSGDAWRGVLQGTEETNDAGLLARLERSARAGLFVAPGLKEVGLAIAPCRDAVRLQVGRNFRLRWLGAVGMAEEFAIEVGFRVIVSDPDAIRVFTKTPSGQGTQSRRRASRT
ncbi:MAG: hypothetical protein HPY69_02910 [Armatimonadetes bacterium]|nr:hypothetical protein [Armatimonadota bacterium]